MWLSFCVVFSGFFIVSQFNENSSKVSSVIELSCHITVAFVFCQIIAAEALGENNFLVRFLSKDVFIRYSKLTYAVYLIHPILINIIFGLLGNALQVNVLEFVSMTIEIERQFEFSVLQAVFAYIILKVSNKIAELIAVYIEIPFCKLSKLLQSMNSIHVKLM
jgi:peptidoglycan/LPS O-acetylase OafA/YrhL